MGNPELFPIKLRCLSADGCVVLNHLTDDPGANTRACKDRISAEGYAAELSCRNIQEYESTTMHICYTGIPGDGLNVYCTESTNNSTWCFEVHAM